MISIVCVYNNEGILNKYLINSLKSQTADYELILIDNTNNKFKSAASALNYGGRKAKGKYIIFAHQDMDLCYNQFLQDVNNYFAFISNLGIAGVAGKCNDKVISNIKHGKLHKSAGNFQIAEPCIVQTLDECLIIIPSDIFKLQEFDEEICDNWHLYAVDYCLNLVPLGLYPYVLPLNIYHRSYTVSLDDGYYNTLEKLLKKNKKTYNWINTTMGNWNTKIPVKIQKIKILRYFLKFFLK